MAARINADLFEIKTERRYPADRVSEEAAVERESGELPELTGVLPDLEEYDTILVGGPVWTYTVSTPLMSYLTQADFNNKNVAAFWTYTNDEGTYEEDFITQAQNAQALPSLRMVHVSSMHSFQIENAVDSWLVDLGFLEQDEIREIQIEESTDIVLQFGDTAITATLDNRQVSQDFIATLPLTITMNEWGGREFYGRIESLSEEGNHLETFTNGDVTYYPPGPSLAIFYDKDDSSPQGNLIKIGVITSDSDVFFTLSTQI